MLSPPELGTSPVPQRDARRRGDEQPPAIILGGGANALSVARSLGRLGATTYAINESTAYVRHSRYCRWVPISGEPPDGWGRFLVGPDSEWLRGGVLLACSDDALEVIARHRDVLSAKFLLDESNPAAQLRMLDKLRTYQEAQAAGVPTPRFWTAETREQVMAVRSSLVFPVIVKPLHTHVYEKRSGKKFEVANDFDQLLRAHEALGAAGIETLIVEWIPGPDDQLCSYYTYLERFTHGLRTVQPP
jgi:D-aspartate ligase